DQRTDLYSTAVMLFELVTGRKPFIAEDLMQVLSMHIHKAPPKPRDLAPEAHISPALEKVILRGLAKDRDDRFVDAQAFLAELDATPEGVEASRPRMSHVRPVAAVTDKLETTDAPTRPKVKTQPKRSRGLWWMFLLVLAGAAGALVART